MGPDLHQSQIQEMERPKKRVIEGRRGEAQNRTLECLWTSGRRLKKRVIEGRRGEAQNRTVERLWTSGRRFALLKRGTGSGSPSKLKVGSGSASE
jgi:hypothetical protein